MKDNYAGIDYGRGMSNVDHETGIRYGVISQNEVGQAWYDSSEPNYFYNCPKCEMEVGHEFLEVCPHCKYEIQDGDFDFIEPISHFLDDGEHVAECGGDGDIFITKSPYFTYAQFCSPCAPGAVYLMTPYKPKEDEINIFKHTGVDGSPPPNCNGEAIVITHISRKEYGEAFRSHAEAAGFARGYCFGHDWYESGKAPYPVFSVETGEIVQPESEV